MAERVGETGLVGEASGVLVGVLVGGAVAVNVGQGVGESGGVMLGNAAIVGEAKADVVSGVQVGGTAVCPDWPIGLASGEAVTVAAKAMTVGISDDSGPMTVSWQPAKIIRNKTNIIDARIMT